MENLRKNANSKLNESDTDNGDIVLTNYDIEEIDSRIDTIQSKE